MSKLIEEVLVLYSDAMSNNGSQLQPWLIDLWNGTGSVIAIVVGILLLGDGLGDGGLPFLLIGLLLIAVGAFRVWYRLSRGKWFRLFGRKIL